MSRVQVSRGVIPRICKDYYELEIWYTGNGSDTFDPTFTTASATQIELKPDDAPVIVSASGTSHAFSYVPIAGLHKCTVTVRGGLGLVMAIDGNTDAITNNSFIRKLVNCLQFTLYGNSIPSCNLSDFNKKCTLISIGGTGCTGSLATLSYNSALTTIYANDNPLISGSLSDLPASLQNCRIYNNTLVIAASIAHLINIRDLRIFSMGWSVGDLTIVIDSMYSARANYTYAFPSLQIGGTNPGLAGGTPGVALPAPTVTPGDENSNDDWSWNGTYHVPLTTKAKAYYLVNGPDHGTDTFNHWSISANN